MTIKQWLKACGDHIKDLQPVRVTIGAESWEGCRYTQVGTYPKHHEKAGQTYEQHRIYCVGKYPKSYRPSRQEGGVCYPFEGHDWYICCYITDIQPNFTAYHPFGANFILDRWDSRVAIDEYEQPYERIPMVVDKLG